MKDLVPKFCCLLCCISLLLVEKLSGQTEVPSAGDLKQEWVSPSVKGDRRSKGIQISYNHIAPFDIISTPTVSGIGGAETRIQKLEEIEFSLRLPIVWKGRTTIAAGVSYLYEEYNFIDPSALTYNLYTNLQNKHLNSIDAKVYAVYALNNRAFIGSRIGLELNGDYQDNELPFRQQAKASIAAVYGWKPNPYTVYGVGAYYSYTLGRPSVYPVFIWNKTFNDRWGVEAVLPQSFRIRRDFTDKTILLFGAKIRGRSYHIISDEPPLKNYPYLELRNSNVYAFLEFEQEIYDFLWFGLTAGYRYSINFNVSEEDSFSNSRIIENDLGHSPYFNVSLFVVPPQAWVD